MFTLMRVLSIIAVVLFGSLWIGYAALLGVEQAFSSQRLAVRWRRWTSLIGSLLLCVGGIGFFGTILSATGGLDWLPKSVQWPVGYATGVIRTDDGLFVVPLKPAWRVQIYDQDWNFLRGWHVDAGARSWFGVASPAPNRIYVFTGGQQLVYSIDGDLISRTSCEPESYSGSLDEGVSRFVPTAPWLIVFSHPFISLAIAFIGGIMWKSSTGNSKHLKTKSSDAPI